MFHHCNVCGHDHVGVCSECGAAMCKDHNFKENHEFDCVKRNIDQFLYS